MTAFSADTSNPEFKGDNKAFQTLKKRLTSSLILWLSIFQNRVPFILRMDASDNRCCGNYRGQGYGRGNNPVKVEALEISFIMQQGEATSLTFVRSRDKRGPVMV